MTTIHMVGGEKGGVGKSVLARVLCQYAIDTEQTIQAFDTDKSHGALARFYADYAAPVDVQTYESLDQIVESAAEQQPDAVVVDLAAQTLNDLTRWMDDSEVDTLVSDLGTDIILWHVMDDGMDALSLAGRFVQRMEAFHAKGADVAGVIVLNEGRGRDFKAFEESEIAKAAADLGIPVVRFPKLTDSAMRRIDRANASFWSATQAQTQSPPLGMMDRQRTRVWLRRAYAAVGAIVGGESTPGKA